MNDCPACKKPVVQGTKGLDCPVLWEGREVWGHTGCLMDILYARARDEYDPARSVVAERLNPESQL